jgi:hypothetical protein
MVTSSLDTDVDRFIIIRKLVDSVFNIRCKRKSLGTKAAYSVHDPISTMFQTGYTNTVVTKRLQIFTFTSNSRHSAVGIATGIGLDDRGGWSPSLAGSKECSLLHVVQTGSGVHPTYPMGTGILSSGVKRPGREADHSPQTSTEVKKNMTLIHPLLHTPSWRSA